MIQRIQTLYLALIFAICFTVASVKLYELTPGETAKSTISYTATVWKITGTDKLIFSTCYDPNINMTVFVKVFFCLEKDG